MGGAGASLLARTGFAPGPSLARGRPRLLGPLRGAWTGAVAATLAAGDTYTARVSPAAAARAHSGTSDSFHTSYGVDSHQDHENDKNASEWIHIRELQKNAANDGN